MCDGGEERIMTNSKGFEPLPLYLSRVSLQCFCFFYDIQGSVKWYSTPVLTIWFVSVYEYVP